MVQKRQLAEEEYDVSPKHLKLEHSCELVPSLQFTKEVFCQSDKDEGCFFKPIIGVDYGFVSGKSTDLPVCNMKDVDYTFTGSLSASSFASSTTSEEDEGLEAPLQTPDYSPLKQRTLIQPEDAYSFLLGHSPLKKVPIGPEYQADIPEWHGNDAHYSSLCSGSSSGSTLLPTSETNSISYGKDEIKFLGYCVIPMPEDSTIHDNTAGRGRTDCYCKNPGSLGCVNQHIKEAREILKERIGHEKLAELGFGNMGELVAEKWTEEDEQLFHEVVYSNPASLGKNFWDCLAEAFPSRTNQEIVSYYFNVFVLRRRAEQNRCDPVNVDSDDDEWQGSERSEEEDDSCQDEIHLYDSYEHGNGIENPIINHDKDVGPHDQIGCTNFSESQPVKLHNSCSFDSTSQPSEKTMVDESGEGDHDLQYDSCTSSDTAGAARMNEGKANRSKPWGNHLFTFEPSDSRVWDVGYFSCPSIKTDFLPTGSMIEEVFGVGSWNFEVTDDDKSSN